MVRTLLSIVAAAATSAVCLWSQQTVPAQPTQTISLPGVKGNFDHFGVDSAHGRLFATLQAEGVVEVFESSSGRKIATIRDIGRPHAVLYRADLDRLYITDGNHDHGKVHVVDGTSFQVLKTVDLAPGAEQFGYDPGSGQLFVANGGHDANSPFGFVSVVDTRSAEKLADIRVETPNLEGVAVETSGSRLFVNDRLHSQVVVVDRNQRSVVATWQIATAKLNVAMALDEGSHRLFVGCRSGQIVVFNTETGKEVVNLPIAEGVGDLMLDPATKRLFGATGSGARSLEIYHQGDPDHYERYATIVSGPGGKNGTFASLSHRYFVGVPEHAGSGAAILVYDFQ